MGNLVRRLAVARGDEPADLVIRGGQVFSVFTREWLELDVAVCDGYVAGLGQYDGEEVLDASDRFVVPGFIDAHMHFEVTKLFVDEFARLVLPLGTTTVVADPHEVANVLGVEGVQWLIDVCSDLPLDVYFMAPSCVPASPFESPRHALTTGDLEALLRSDRVLGLAEMMNFPGVIAGEVSELAKLRLAEAAHVDGHAPGVLGKQLNAYAAAGIRSDHEALTLEEGRARLRAGMWLLIREASMARNLDALLPLVREFGPTRIAFCTDDRDPEHIAAEGHINSMARAAVASGIAPEDALLLASHHAALCHNLRHLGAIAPAYQADLLILPDLERFEPDLVLKAGKPVPEIAKAQIPAWVRDTVHIENVTSDDFRVPWTGGPARVIGLVSDQVVTDALVEELTVGDGCAVADPERDLAKIALLERHHSTGRVGLGFVRGFGLKSGALASTVAHDAHNIIVVGVDDGDMAQAVQRLAELGGGIVAVEHLDVRAECPLVIAGLMSDAPLAEVMAQSQACNDEAKRLGCTITTPFLTMSFLGLSVIPKLKITDSGLIDVDRFALVPLAADLS